MRADLHVHSSHSGQSGNLRFLRSRDCYSAPEQVYQTARARGMDLVTITDHDSIDGCLELLDRLPGASDFIIGEEVSCRLPEGDLEIHLGVYGLDEQLHRDLQPLRGNVFEVTGYLRQQKVFFCLNHLLHFYGGQVTLPAYLRLLDEMPGLEARNGTMLAAHNRLVERIADGYTGKTWSKIGGTDAHTLRRIGRTWTEANAGNKEEFLEALRSGATTARGAHGNAAVVSGDVYGVVLRYIASLAGAGPRDHYGVERVACLAFSALSLPCQFLPLAMAAWSKRHERRAVRQVATVLAPALQASSDAVTPFRQVDA